MVLYWWTRGPKRRCGSTLSAETQFNKNALCRRCGTPWATTHGDIHVAPLGLRDGRTCCSCRLMFPSGELIDCDGCPHFTCDRCIGCYIINDDDYWYCPCCVERWVPPPPPPLPPGPPPGPSAEVCRSLYDPPVRDGSLSTASEKRTAIDIACTADLLYEMIGRDTHDTETADLRSHVK